LIDLETHEAVFTWMLQRLADAGLIKGKTVGIDATTREANAALRSIVRRDTGESYQDFLTKLAQASGIETPTRPVRPLVRSACARLTHSRNAVRLLFKLCIEPPALAPRLGTVRHWSGHRIRLSEDVHQTGGGPRSFKNGCSPPQRYCDPFEGRGVGGRGQLFAHRNHEGSRVSNVPGAASR
jgi:hypothetical protein